MIRALTFFVAVTVLLAADLAGTYKGSYSGSAGAQAVVSLFAAWGLGQLILCLLCIVVLVRYRALVPFLFAVLLLEHLSRRLIFLVMPIVRMGTPPGVFVNLALLL